MGVRVQMKTLAELYDEVQARGQQEVREAGKMSPKTKRELSLAFKALYSPKEQNSEKPTAFTTHPVIQFSSVITGGDSQQTDTDTDEFTPLLPHPPRHHHQ